MSRQLPFLPMDGVLCDYSLPLFGGKTTTKKETTKMNKTLSADQLSRYVGMRIRNPAAADRYWEKCMGRDIAVDAAMDVETVEKLKGFLKNRLSAEDHEQVCNMLAGDVEAQDEPPPGGTEPPAKFSGAAADARLRDDFSRRYPGLANIRIDNLGLPIPRRAASPPADAASFYARFPEAARIKLA